MLYEPQHNTFRGANKIICGVDITVTRLLRIFFLNECLTNIFALSELKKSLAQVLLLKVTNFKDFQFTSVMFWCTKHGTVFTSLVCSVIYTGVLHILIAKSCHTSSKEIFNVLWQLAVLAMDSQLFCHILKYPVPFNQTKLFNTTTFKSCVNISAMNESLTNHNKLMANCDIPLWIQLGQVQYKFLWFLQNCTTAGWFHALNGQIDM